MRPADAEALEEFARRTGLLSRGVPHVTKLVPFPVRFLFTASTGRVGTNDAARPRYLGDDRAPIARRRAVAADEVARAFRGRRRELVNG